MSGNSPSKVTQMTSKLGRPSDYDSQEDAIILSTTDTSEVQRLLAKAGKKERSPAAIISRRKKLREEQEALADNGTDAAAEQLFKHRRRLTRQLEILSEERQRVEAEIEEVNARLRDLI